MLERILLVTNFSRNRERCRKLSLWKRCHLVLYFLILAIPILIIRKRLPKRITYRNKCTSHGVVHCTSKNQINQEQLQEKCRREVGVMSSTILCCCPFLGLWMTLWHGQLPNYYLSSCHPLPTYKMRIYNFIINN